MFYDRLPKVAHHLAKTHRLFGGRKATPSNILNIVGNAHGKMLMTDKYPTITYKAWTDADHGNLHTEITFQKLHNKHGFPAGWEVTETIIRA